MYILKVNSCTYMSIISSFNEYVYSLLHILLCLQKYICTVKSADYYKLEKRVRFSAFIRIMGEFNYICI